MLNINKALQCYKDKHGHKTTRSSLSQMVIHDDTEPNSKLLRFTQWSKGLFLNRVTQQDLRNFVEITGITYGELLGIKHKKGPCCESMSKHIIAKVLDASEVMAFTDAVYKVCTQYKVNPQFIFDSMTEVKPKCNRKECKS